MAKGIYFGVGGTAKKVKKLYIGVNGMARKVKKVFIGVGGIPKLTYISGINYGGTATSLSYAAQSGSCSGGHNSNYAVFSLITYGTGTTTDAYDANIVKAASPANLTTPRLQGASATIGENVLFAGGYNSTDSNSRDIQGYNASLVRSSVLTLSQGVFVNLGASSASSAIFLGGVSSRPSSSNTTWTNAGTAVNTNLTYNTSVYGWSGSTGNACTFNDSAVFTFNSARSSNECIVYTANNTRLNISPFCPSSSYDLGQFAVINNTYLLVPYTVPATDVVDVYNTSFVKVSTVNLSGIYRSYSAYSFSEYGILAFPRDANSNTFNLFDVFDAQLTRDTVVTPTNRSGAFGTQIGNNLILAAGNYTNTVEYYTV
jgi:hypothetical protein